MHPGKPSWTLVQLDVFPLDLLHEVGRFRGPLNRHRLRQLFDEHLLSLLLQILGRPGSGLALEARAPSFEARHAFDLLEHLEKLACVSGPVPVDLSGPVFQVFCVGSVFV
jgi:hypothetical protein